MNEMRCKNCNKLLGEYSAVAGEVKIRILCKCKTFYTRHIFGTEYNESNMKNQSLKRAIGVGDNS